MTKQTEFKRNFFDVAGKGFLIRVSHSDPNTAHRMALEVEALIAKKEKSRDKK